MSLRRLAEVAFSLGVCAPIGLVMYGAWVVYAVALESKGARR